MLCAVALCAVAHAQFTVQGVPYKLKSGQVVTTRSARDPKPTTDQFSFDDIEFWVGEGENEAAFAVQWNFDNEPTSLVWGYRWTEEADGTGEAMIRAIVRADKHFYIMTQTGTQYGSTVAGLGYDANGDGLFSVTRDGKTLTPDSARVIYIDGYDYDGWEPTDPGDWWRSGWYEGYWSYWVKASREASWTYSSVGITGRRLTDGCWDGWNYAVNMSSQPWKDHEAAPQHGPAQVRIQTQPQDLWASVGDAASLTVSAKGLGLTYQWYKDGQPVTTGTAPTLSFESLTADNAGEYYCVVSGTAIEDYDNRATTDTVTLTVGDKPVACVPISDTEAAVVFSEDYLAYAGTVTVPATATIDDKDYAVTSVGRGAFAGCGQLTAVVLPTSVATVGDSAFVGCHSLASINLGQVKSVGAYAFAALPALTEADLSGVQQVGTGAFSGAALASLTLPAQAAEAGVQLGASAFEGCTALRQADLSQVTTVGARAFAGCTAFDVAGDVPQTDRLVSVGDSAYFGCTSLSAYRLPASVQQLGQSVFEGCTALKSLTVESTVGLPGHFAYGCITLDAVSLSDGLASIGEEAFRDCDSLSVITLPATLDSLGEGVFRGCESLASVALPAGVTKVPDYAFYGCGALATLTCQGSVEEVGSYAFYNCSQLAALPLQETLTTIGSRAFYGCNAITGTLVIPDKVTAVGSNAFSYMRGITRVEIGSGVTAIPGRCFADCSALESVQMNGAVTEIGEYAFQNCKLLASVTWPESLESLGTYAFSNCSALDSVVLPAGVTALPHRLFAGCTSLKNLQLPDGLTSIGNYTFYNCTGLDTLPMTPALTSIGMYAFEGCTFTEVLVPDHVTSLGNAAFRNNAQLQQAVLGTGVQALNNQLFQSCRALKSVIVKGEITGKVGTNAFASCSSLERIEMVATPTAPSASSSSFSSVPTATCLLYVPGEEAVASYQAASYWKNFANIVPFLEVVAVEPGMAETQDNLPMVDADVRSFAVTFNRALLEAEQSAVAAVLSVSGGDTLPAETTLSENGLTLTLAEEAALPAGATLTLTLSLYGEDLAVFHAQVSGSDPGQGTGLDRPAAASWVRAEGLTLHVYSPSDAALAVYTLDGHRCYAGQAVGHVQVALPATGVYVVRLNDETVKVMAQ